MKYLFFIDRHDLNISRHFWPIYMETLEWRHSSSPTGVIASLDIGLIGNKEMWRYKMIFSSVRRYCRCVVELSWVLELSAWPECQHSQHHVTKQKLRAMTCCGSRPSDWTPARSRAGRRCDFTTVLSTYHPLSLSGWLTIFFAVREIICGFVLNADPSHFGTVLWYFSFAKLDPRILWWD